MINAIDLAKLRNREFLQFGTDWEFSSANDFSENRNESIINKVLAKELGLLNEDIVNG